MKFKKGDRIRVVGSDRMGYNYATIVEVVNSNGYWGYSIEWDHFKRGACFYKASIVDNTWELDPLSTKCPVVTEASKPQFSFELPRGFMAKALDGWSQDVSCDHSWVDYRGLTEVYEFCKNCDERRSK